MKNKVLVFTVGLLLVGLTSFAQSLKIGYTNVDYILTQMPEYKQIEASIKEYTQQLEKQLQSKIEEFQQKGREYQESAATMVPEVRQDKEEELQNLQASIQKFQRDADAAVQKKQMELLQPAYDKIQKAITDVATANGYTHVLSDGMGAINILLYAREEDDVTNLVLENMGITPEASSN
ncbi:MAG: OmpH family outer membrane protein [Candidatus Cyclobacteriaceae bacterium M3_2C_046]